LCASLAPYEAPGRTACSVPTLETPMPAAAAPPARRPLGRGPGSGSEPVADPVPAGPEAPAGFTVRLDNFEGPFDLLLQLIAKHKLDVTEVALSKVTDEFMAHIR